MGEDMFKNVKVGDRLYSLRDGEMIVVDVVNNDDDKRIHVCSGSGECVWITYCGRERCIDKHPTFFWSEPEIIPPKPPLPDLKRDAKVVVWLEEGGKKYFRHFHSFRGDGYIVTYGDGKTSFTGSDQDLDFWTYLEVVE